MKFSNVKSIAKIAKATVVKYSPEILMGIGAASFVATVVAVAKESVKEADIIFDHKVELDDLAIQNQYGDLDKKAYRKSRINVYKHTTILTVKNYAPAAVFSTMTLSCFFGAFGIMKKRYTTVVMAYTALEESFRRYRARVIEDRGTDADLYYLTGVKPKEITTKDEEGNKIKTKSLTLPDGTVLASPYAFKFSKYKENGERNNQWSDSSTMNMSYVLGQMDWLNEQLYHRCVFDHKHRVKVRGTVMLNEARELLGESATATGAVVGWRYSNGEPGCNGYIEFNVVEGTEVDPDSGRDIPCLFINPNVDGMIYDLIGQKEEKPFEPAYGLWGEDVTV